MTAEEMLKSKYEGKRYSFPKDKELWAAMKEIAERSFDAGFTRGYLEGIINYNSEVTKPNEKPTKEQFINQLFKTNTK